MNNDERGPPAPGTEAWWKLAGALRELAGDIGFDDLRDVLWLAKRLPRQKSRRRKRAVEAAAAASGVAADAGTRAADSAARSNVATPLRDAVTRRVPVDEPADEPPAAVYAGSITGAGTAARRIRLPAPHPLPDALSIGRALQPVTRRRPQGAAALLDEEATAEAIAHTDLVMPVLRQQRERWFELLLAVDDAPSMLAWRARIAEFELLLRRAGFRDVRRVALHSSGNEPAVLRGRSGSPVSPHAAAGGDASTASRLLLVVSDAAGAAWHDGRVSALLAAWSKVLPLALVQTLPSALWSHTAVGFAELEVAAAAPGQVGEQLHERRPSWALGEPGLVMPVLALEAGHVASWARMVMAAGNAWCRAALLPLADEEGPWPEASRADAADVPRRLLESFLAASTPDALELAAAFAVIRPLNLPVMRLIQVVMLPDAGADALAQVLISGLLRQVGETMQEADGTSIGLRDEDIAYEMDDPVRDDLAGYLTRSRWLQVNLAVQRFVEVETGVGFDFIAFIEDRLGLEQVAPSALPFARLAARMADRFVRGRGRAARAGRHVDEPVFAKGLTVMARASTSSPIRRLAWSPSGRKLAGLHSYGIDVWGSPRLGLVRQERANPYRLYCVLPVGVEDLLRGLIDRFTAAAETEFRMPCESKTIVPHESLGGELLFVAGPKLILVIDATWDRQMRKAGFVGTLRDLGSQDRAIVIPLTVSAAEFALRERAVGLRSWIGVLDLPVASKATAQAIDELLRVMRSQWREKDPIGFIDAMGWFEEGATERLLSVRYSVMDKYPVVEGWDEPRPVRPESRHGMIVEYAPATGGVHWLHFAPNTSPADARRVLDRSVESVARFSPDGRSLALIDDRGELSLSLVGKQAER